VCTKRQILFKIQLSLPFARDVEGLISGVSFCDLLCSSAFATSSGMLIGCSTLFGEDSLTKVSVRLGIRGDSTGSGRRRNSEVLGVPNSETLLATVAGVLKVGEETAIFGLVSF
jgi:hypothetical protein